MALGTNEFQCAKCKRIFDKGWTGEEAQAEANQNFPGLDSDNADEAAIVCDYCYNEMMAWLRNN
jgi:DNA-directed RNA polymerase subunit RPC12/RpoP